MNGMGEYKYAEDLFELVQVNRSQHLDYIILLHTLRVIEILKCDSDLANTSKV